MHVPVLLVVLMHWTVNYGLDNADIKNMRELAQLIKVLLCKHEKLSLDLQHQVQRQTSVILALGQCMWGYDGRDSNRRMSATDWNTQRGRISELKAQWETLSQKKIK